MTALLHIGARPRRTTRYAERDTFVNPTKAVCMCARAELYEACSSVVLHTSGLQSGVESRSNLLSVESVKNKLNDDTRAPDEKKIAL